MRGSGVAWKKSTTYIWCNNYITLHYYMLQHAATQSGTSLYGLLVAFPIALTCHRHGRQRSLAPAVPNHPPSDPPLSSGKFGHLAEGQQDVEGYYISIYIYLSIYTLCIMWVIDSNYRYILICSWHSRFSDLYIQGKTVIYGDYPIRSSLVAWSHTFKSLHIDLWKLKKTLQISPELFVEKHPATGKHMCWLHLGM